jgi:hypothetical protein
MSRLLVAFIAAFVGWTTAVAGEVTVSNDGKLVGFTYVGSSGSTFTDLRITKVLADGLQCEHKYGLVTVKWASLPPNIVSKFKAQATKAANADREKARAVSAYHAHTAKVQAEVVRERVARDAAADADERYRQEHATSGQALWIRGRITQKLESGLLVSSEGGHTGQLEISVSPISGRSSTNLIGGMPIYKGTCWVKRHPNHGSLVDGDQVDIVAWDDGQYGYTAVMGGRRTVRAFKCQ